LGHSALLSAGRHYAIDNMLADEALAEGGKPHPLRELLAQEQA
jgi:hypothetical protein